MNSTVLTSSPKHRGRRFCNAALAVVVAVVGCVALATTAQAAGLTFDSFTAGAYNADTTPNSQAGAHPYELNTNLAFGTVLDSRTNLQVPGGALKDTVIQLPPGALGDPNAVPQCRQQDMIVPRLGNCPTDTQIGYADLDLNYVFGRQHQTAAVYNMVPPPGQPAQFAFIVSPSVAHIDLAVRSDSDYGITATVRNTNAMTPVYSAAIHIWGVPADPAHDALRFRPGSVTPGDTSGLPLPSHQPRLALLRNPTSCGSAETTTADARSWEHPDQSVKASYDSPAVTGCDKVPFNPSVKITPETTRAGSAAGLGVDVSVPQNTNPDGLGASDLRRAVMKLPAGVAINPSSADGLQGCSDAQLGKNSTAQDQCPVASKVGSVTVDTPLLPEPLVGDAYIGTPLEQGPTAAAAGRMFRLFLTATGSGVHVKLTGSVVPDPVTGQLVATFDNNPQVPFSNLHLQLAGGGRSPLALPKACGTYTTVADLYPWARPNTPVTTTSSFTIDQNCDQVGRFQPSMSAGLTSPTAGGSSPFTVTLERPDGQQDFASVTMTLPPGLLANVGSVPLCPDAAAATGGCPAASQVGHTTVASGAGATPAYFPQAGKAPTAVYLAGPYKGAPYSLSIVVPAQAGPFDLGLVVVRATLNVDPVDGHVTVTSDAIPRILDGVPLNIQKINITIDRPNFIANPTNCSPMKIWSKIASPSLAVELTNPFQVAGCAALKLEPDLNLSMSGKGQISDGDHPAFTANLKMPKGNANLQKVKVTLPLSLALDPNNSQSDDLCEFVDGSKTIPVCPKSSIVGTATAVTPLLNVPLTGPVYFVKNVRIDPKSGRQIRTLPTLAIPLQGGGITLVVRATSNVVDNHLVTTFDKIPDAAVSSFKLALNGGKKAILVISGANVCKGTQVAQQVATGQNGKVAKDDIVIGTPCTLGVVSSSHTSTHLNLSIGGLGAGRVTVSGDGLAKTSRTLTSSTTATVSAALSRSVRSRLARGHDVKIKVTVSFLPKGAKKAKVAHSTITIHGSKR